MWQAVRRSELRPYVSAHLCTVSLEDVLLGRCVCTSLCVGPLSVSLCALLGALGCSCTFLWVLSKVLGGVPVRWQVMVYPSRIAWPPGIPESYALPSSALSPGFLSLSLSLHGGSCVSPRGCVGAHCCWGGAWEGQPVQPPALFFEL